MTAGRLARAAALVAIFGLVSRLLGFAREIVLAAAYGASGATDAFVNSLLIVNSVAENWRKVRVAEKHAVLKQAMLDRGYRADEIAKVVNSGIPDE